MLGGDAVAFPTGTDELYHLRRIWWDVVHFPAHLGVDSYVNFPHGARTIWPFLFDWTLAGLAKLLVGARDLAAVERVVVWAPPVLGALTAVAIARVGGRLFGWGAGLFAGLWLALLPAHTHNARLGVVDHHVAVALASAWLLSCGTRWCDPSPRRPHGLALELAGVFAVGFLLWPGFLFAVLTFQAFAGLQLIVDGDAARARQRAGELAWAHALAALVLAPFCLGHEWPQFGPFAPEVLSAFQPLWLGASATVLGGLARLWCRPRAGATPARRAAAAVGLAGAALAAGLLVVPGLSEAAFGATRWLAKEDEFMHLVMESTPLLYPKGVLHPGLAQLELSGLVWAFPPAWLWLAWERVRARELGPRGLVLGWSAAFFAATLAQHRFADLFALGYVLVLAGGLAALARLPRGRVAIAAALALAVLALCPTLAHYRGEAVEPAPQSVVEVARWIRDHTPKAAGYLDDSQPPEYGVLASWHDGHRLRYYAERPVVQDNFGVHAGREGFTGARDYYRAGDEEQAFAIARELRARYVLSTVAGSGHDLVIQPHTMAARLRRWLGSEPGPALPALGRHQLVYLRGEGAERVALFEVVPGALVRGTAPPGSVVRFELTLRNAGGPAVRYRARARAASDGAYELRLPYATERTAGSDLQAEGPYTVRCGSGSLALDVSDAEVRDGRAARAPSC